MAKLIEIEGIGQVYAGILTEAGIASTKKLLAVIAMPKRLKSLAERTGFTEQRLLTWAKRADQVEAIETVRIKRKARAVRRMKMAAAGEPTGSGGGRPGRGT